jgi:putative drug exporter of the RND superfamily
MLARLGSFVVRHRRVTLIGILLLTIAAAVFGGGVTRNLIAGGFDPAGAKSVDASEVLEDAYGKKEPNVVLVVTAADCDVNSEQSRTAGDDVTGFVAGFARVDFAASYWTLPDPPPLRRSRGDRALGLAHVEGETPRRSSAPKTSSMLSRSKASEVTL